MEENLQREDVCLKELRQRVDDKAEKMIKYWFKSNIYDVLGTLLIIVMAIVFPILNHYFSWVETDWTSYFFETLIIAIGVVVVLWLMKHYINKMKCADSVSQQYRAAKQYMRTIQWGHLLILFLPLVIVDTINDGDIGASVFAFCVYIIVMILALYFKPNLFIDKEFSEDVEELGLYE